MGKLMIQTLAFLIALTWLATTLTSISGATGKWGMDPEFLYPGIPILLIGTPLIFTALILYKYWSDLDSTR